MSKDVGNDDNCSRLAVGTKATKTKITQLLPRRRCLWLGMVLLGLALAMFRYNTIVLSPYYQSLESIHHSDYIYLDAKLSNGEKDSKMAITAAAFPNTANTTHSTATTSPVAVKDPIDTRPWLVLHVGPPKTATTTIQDGLALCAQQLARDDNWYFLGHSRQQVVVVDKNNETFTVGRLRDLDDSKTFRTELEQHHKLGHNVVLSAEQYTHRKHVANQFFYVDKFLLPIEEFHDHKQESSSSLEPFFKFRVKIVVGYRHLFELLPSRHHQTYVYGRSSKTKVLGNNISKVPGVLSFIDEWLERLVQYQYQEPKNSDENTIYSTSDLDSMGGIHHDGTMEATTSHASVFAYLKWSSPKELRDRVSVLDLHQQLLLPLEAATATTFGNSTPSGDVLADFVCHMLPSALHTCNKLRKRTQNNSSNTTATTILRKRVTSTNAFVSTEDKHRIQDYAKNSLSMTPKSRYIFRRIDQWFATKAKLTSPRDALEKPSGQTLVNCMNETTRDRLKSASWNSLVQLVFLVHNSNQSNAQKNDQHFLLSNNEINMDLSNDHSWMGPTKKAHDAAFETFAASGKFCEINLQKLFANESFVKDVFQSRN